MLYLGMTQENSLLAKNWKIDWCDDVLTTKVLVLKFGLLLAQKAGCNRLVINSDNMKIINTMKNKGLSAEWRRQFLIIAFLWLANLLG